MIIVSALESILPIILMIAVGFILAARGWFDDAASRLISRIVNNIALPAYMLWNLMSTFDREKLVHLAGGLVIPVVSMLLCCIIGYVVARVIGVAPNHQGTFRSMYFVSNTIFVGLPINLALFGEGSVPYVLLYYISNAAFFWTLGIHGIRNDGTGSKQSIFCLETLRKIVSPPLMGFICAVILILLGISLPKFALDTCRYLGNLTTPLSMLFIGIAIQGANLKAIRINKDMIAVLLGRFVVSPLTIFGLASLLPIPVLMKQVFVIQAAMPVMTQTSIISKAYNADPEYAAVMTTVTTIAVIAVIPIYMAMMQ